MSAEPGRPNEVSPIRRIDRPPIRRIDTPACDPFKRGRTQLHLARLAVAEPVRGVVRLRGRDDVLLVEGFDSVLEARTVITDWRTIYNHGRPHSESRLETAGGLCR